MPAMMNVNVADGAGENDIANTGEGDDAGQSLRALLLGSQRIHGDDNDTITFATGATDVVSQRWRRY